MYREPPPDIGDWKPHSFGDNLGTIYEYKNPKFKNSAFEVRNHVRPGWRIALPGGSFDRAIGGRVRVFSTAKTCVRAIEREAE